MSNVSGFHHIGITVKDLKKSLDFYSKSTGMSIKHEGDDFGGMEGDGFSLWLATSRDYLPKDLKYDRNQLGLDHLSFKVHSLEKLKKIEATLKEMGAEMEDGGITDDGYGTDNIAIYAKAPDGMKVEFHL